MLKDENLNIVMDFFEKEVTQIQEEYNTYLEQNSNNQILLNEIKNKIELLSSKVDSTEDVFSPRNEKKDFETVEINKLNESAEKIENNIHEIKQKINDLLEKEEKFNKMIDICKKIKINNEKYDIDDCIEKAEFCDSLVLVDPNRCKMELQELITMMQNIRK